MVFEVRRSRPHIACAVSEYGYEAILILGEVELLVLYHYLVSDTGRLDLLINGLFKLMCGSLGF